MISRIWLSDEKKNNRLTQHDKTKGETKLNKILRGDLRLKLEYHSRRLGQKIKRKKNIS